MRILRRFAFPLLAFVTLSAVAIGFERTFSPVFQQCVDNHEHQKAASSAHDQPARLGTVVKAYVGCSGDLLIVTEVVLPLSLR